MGRDPRPLSWLWLAAGLTAASPSATAEEAPEPPAGEVEAAAREAFERGLAGVAEGDCERALAAFELSLRLYPTEAAMQNHALCLRDLGRPAEAVRRLDELLARFGSGLPDARRRAVADEIDALRRGLGRIVVEVRRPEVAYLRLDGLEVGTAPLDRALDVEPGPHLVEVHAEGFRPTARELVVEAGGVASLSVALEAVPSPAPARVGSGAEEPLDEASPATPPVAARSRAGDRALRTASYALAAVGTAGLAAAMAIYLWNDGRHEDWNAEDERIRSLLGRGGSEELLADIEANNDLAVSIERGDRAGWAVLSVSAAAVAAAVVTLALGLRRGSAPRLSLVSRPGYLGLSVRGATP